jgi:hypothetical protein
LATRAFLVNTVLDFQGSTVDTEMYIPLSLGIMTLVSLLMVIVGQIVTLLKVNNLSKTSSCMMGVGAVGLAGAAASKAGWFKASWEFVKLTIEKFKDKFKHKAAEKIVDTTEETLVSPDQVAKTEK